ncbi:hypothetical protein NIES267_56780 [Calothrix parasitica NIES-267]|uniref:Uncharacterized protein n=1 Tax=Calothrix parasitica NIES-267 TaxID=1973488 RepID=A0A1Z4LY76_9CYAN|nr:hypothetical protein NIES267_56780 [Calothrix parasitica NIES-267]
MARSRYGSRRLRYLKARLSIFTRPAFLVAAVFLSVVGFVVKEYWTNPDFFELSQIRDSLSSTSSQSSNSQSSLSDEDRAIAADIDNLSVLDYDKEQANILPIPTTSINDNSKIKKQNEAQLNKILDLTKKNQKEQRIPANTGQLKTPNTPSASQQNPFLKQAEDLLKFKVDTGNLNGTTNNLSPFSSNPQTSTGSFNLGINNNFVNPNQTTNPQSALQKAITESSQNKQNQEKSTENSAAEKNNFGQIPQSSQKADSPDSSTNRRLPQNQTNFDVNTSIFNQPLNTQPQNPYNNFNNFNNNQFPQNNLNQPGLNNQPQNPYGNFNNNQAPTNNNQLQNPYGNPNNTQVPRNNYAQPTNPSNNFNNQNQNIQQQNPYSNFNRSQPSVNNSFQNPYNNFNNQRRVNGYSPQIQTRINNIYDRLVNRDFPSAATRNNYTVPNNNVNRGFQQPNVQQFNSPYNQQNQIQYPN